MESGSRVWSAFSADPREPASAELRASDADRDHALDVLREAYADGRLTHDEFDARSAAVLSSRTLGGLVQPLVDLVVATSVSTVRRTINRASLREQAVAEYQRDLRDARNGWLAISGLTVAIWGASAVATGGLPFFWPIFPSLGVGVGFFLTFLNREERIEAIEDKASQRRERDSD